MFFRRSTRQNAPQQVQGEQTVSASTSMPALELESVSVFTELPEGGHRRILKDGLTGVEAGFKSIPFFLELDPAFLHFFPGCWHVRMLNGV